MRRDKPKQLERLDDGSLARVRGGTACGNIDTDIGDAAAQAELMKTKHDTVKNSISNVR
jgi:hypothetical protein